MRVVVQNDLYWTPGDVEEAKATPQSTVTDASAPSRPPQPTRPPPKLESLRSTPGVTTSVGDAQVSISPGSRHQYRAVIEELPRHFKKMPE